MYIHIYGQEIWNSRKDDVDFTLVAFCVCNLVLETRVVQIVISFTRKKQEKIFLLFQFSAIVLSILQPYHPIIKEGSTLILQKHLNLTCSRIIDYKMGTTQVQFGIRKPEEVRRC